MRLGETYKSLDVDELRHCRTGAALASISQANAGLARRDLLRTRDAREALRRHTCAERIAICAEAGELFMHGDVPLDDGHMQSPQAYVEMLSATTGLPHTLCRRNMQKIFTVLSGMDAILAGLTRGLDLQVIDEGIGEQAGVPVSFMAEADHLAVVLPNNSPGVNSIWLPAVALKIPVLIKPGGEEPWTPWRIIQSLIVAGFPREGLGFYPTDHEGANTLLRAAGKAMIFGDDQTVQRYANDPCVQVHGPGRSKVIIGADEIERWRDYIDVLVASVADNSGRSCINASTIRSPTPWHAGLRTSRLDRPTMTKPRSRASTARRWPHTSTRPSMRRFAKTASLTFPRNIAPVRGAPNTTAATTCSRLSSDVSHLTSHWPTPSSCFRLLLSYRLIRN